MELDGEIVGGRFLVPMRSIFEGLGATVQWEGETRTVTGKKGDTTVTLIIDRKFADVNGSIIRLDVPAQIVNDRTYVPARLLASLWEQRCPGVSPPEPLLLCWMIPSSGSIRTDQILKKQTK